MKKRYPSFDDIQAIERLTGGDYCEAAGLLCYASTHSKGIILKNLRDGTEQTIRFSGRGEASPSFSPDGRRLTFLSVVPGAGRQVIVCDLVSGELRQLSHESGVAMEPIWSPDGRKIAFSRLITGSSEKNGRRDEPVVIEDFGYKFDGRGFIRLDEHMQLFVVDVENGSEECVAKGDCDYLHHSWMPDSEHLVCAGDRFRSKEEGLGYDLLKINIHTKEITRLTTGLWIVSYPNPLRPLCLPDGKSVIAGVLDPEVGLDNENGIYPQVYFYRIPADGSGEAVRLFYGDEGCYQCVQFPYNACGGWGLEKVQLDEDGKTLYFVSGWQGQCNLYRLDLNGDGHAELVAGGKQVYHGLGRIQNGKMLVSRVSTEMPEAYYKLDVRTGALEEKLLQSAEAFMQEVSLEKTEDFFFDSPDGSARIHGFVIPPYGRKPGEKYPTILYIHGGPTPFYTYGLTLEHHAFAAEGFGVIFCNPRGSSGYGWAHQNVAGEELDRAAYTDCLQFAREATLRYDWIDGGRMGVTGGSFGGYLTNYIATHSKKFKAYITQRSVTNQLIEYASADLQGVSKGYDSYEEFMVTKLKESPVAYAERIDRPILILHGMDDYRTPVEGAHQFFVAIKDLHPELPVKMLLFPNTGHGQPSVPQLAKRYYSEMVDWFRKYL